RDAHRERDTGPEHVLAREHALLAAALVGELLVDPERPVRAVRVDLLIGDPLDEVVVDSEVAVWAVDGEATELRGVVERAGRGRSRPRLGAAVRAVACMRAGGVGRYIVPVGRDGPVEHGPARPLHAQVDGDGQSGGRGSRGQGEHDERRWERCPAEAIEHQPPLPRGSYGLGRSQVSWLRAPRRAFPASRRLTSGFRDASAPVHSGGTARDSHPASLATGRRTGPAYPTARDAPTTVASGAPAAARI